MWIYLIIEIRCYNNHHCGTSATMKCGADIWINFGLIYIHSRDYLSKSLGLSVLSSTYHLFMCNQFRCRSGRFLDGLHSFYSLQVPALQTLLSPSHELPYSISGASIPGEIPQFIPHISFYFCKCLFQSMYY